MPVPRLAKNDMTFLGRRRVLLTGMGALLAACTDDITVVSKAYKAQANIDGFDVSVEMTSAHRTLAEYAKHVEIRRGSVSIASFSLADTGGNATVYVIVDPKQMLVFDGMRVGKVIAKGDGSVEDMEPDEVPRNLDAAVVGRFEFVYTSDEKTYQWVPNAKP